MSQKAEKTWKASSVLVPSPTPSRGHIHGSLRFTTHRQESQCCSGHSTRDCSSPSIAASTCTRRLLPQSAADLLVLAAGSMGGEVYRSIGKRKADDRPEAVGLGCRSHGLTGAWTPLAPASDDNTPHPASACQICGV